MTFTAGGEGISRVSLYFSDTLVFFYRKKKGFDLGGGVSRKGVKEDERGQKKINFFHRTYGKCVVPCGITEHDWVRLIRL